MKIELKIAPALTAGLLCVGIIQAQHSVNASGSVASGMEGSLSYSVGQIVYTTQIDNSGSLSQGVQHAYEIFLSDSREVQSGITISIFPNPTADHLILDIAEYNREKLSCFVYNSSGKLLFEKEIEEKQTLLEMGTFPSETYFIKIANKEIRTVQSFRIIKH